MPTGTKEKTQATSRAHLPLIFPIHLKWPALLFLFCWFLGLYLFANQNTGNATVLPLTGIDKAVPFWPLTVWIYASVVPFFVVVGRLVKDKETLNTLFFSIATTVLISTGVYLLFPVAYPRSQFPLPSTTDPITHWIFSGLRNVDQISNCLPSLHVGLPVTAVFVLRFTGKIPTRGLALWALLISFSSLATKQHYFIDVASAFLLGTFVSYLFCFRFKKQSHL